MKTAARAAEWRSHTRRGEIPVPGAKTEMTNDNIKKGIILLIRSAIEGTPVVLPDNFTWDEALKVAGMHQITSILWYGVHKSGIKLPDDIHVRLKQETYCAAFMDECQNNELSELFNAFSDNNIDYMPLKGILLKQFYSKPEMRLMGDADILIRVEQYKVISDIMKRLKYYENVESDHELIWSKFPAIVIELHKRLIPSYNKDYYAYFGDGWQLAQRSEYDKFRYEMGAEDQLIYLFTHFSKHYRDGGVGIKHFVDFWVFLSNNPELNMDYIQRELTKLQLYQFYLNILNTIDVWFRGTPTNEVSSFITERLFASGAYGLNSEKLVAASVKSMKSAGSASRARMVKVFTTIFAPYSSMCTRYPALKIMPILLPAFWAVRMIQAVLFKPENVRKQIANMRIITVNNIKRYHDELNYVGLDFNFKE